MKPSHLRQKGSVVVFGKNGKPWWIIKVDKFIPEVREPSAR